ncbi:hypothetical protein B0H19DRAFT_1233309 [Mycena capillaripes]|nr:hypothetical protein B0H19DRAFT_1233309 [Mycena capillaripes]
MSMRRFKLDSQTGFFSGSIENDVPDEDSRQRARIFEEGGQGRSRPRNNDMESVGKSTGEGEGTGMTKDSARVSRALITRDEVTIAESQRALARTIRKIHSFPTPFPDVRPKSAPVSRALITRDEVNITDSQRALARYVRKIHSFPTPFPDVRGVPSLPESTQTPDEL